MFQSGQVKTFSNLKLCMQPNWVSGLLSAAEFPAPCLQLPWRRGARSAPALPPHTAQEERPGPVFKIYLFLTAYLFLAACFLSCRLGAPSAKAEVNRHRLDCRGTATPAPESPGSSAESGGCCPVCFRVTPTEFICFTACSHALLEQCMLCALFVFLAVTQAESQLFALEAKSERSILAIFVIRLGNELTR